MRVASFADRSGQPRRHPWRPALGDSAALLLLGVLATCAACAPLDTNVPSGFDLSGDWLLVDRLSDAAPDIEAIRRREDREVVRGRQTDPLGSAAFVVTDFPVLGARRMSIEQNADSMGIRYDGDTYRDISWGVRERDFWLVQAGWEEDVLVVRSTRGSVKGVERMALEDGGSRLRVTAAIDTKGGDVRLTRVYRRR